MRDARRPAAQWAADGGVLEFDKPGFRIVTARTWSFDQRGFSLAFEELRKRPPSRPAWVFDAGWGEPVSRFFEQHEELKEWPGNNAVFQLPHRLR